MAQRIGLGLAFVVAFAGLGWWLLVKTPAEPQDLITLAAVAFACLAWFQSRRSANAATANAALAQLNEERSKYGWTITLHPNGDHYVLRNIGTLAAQDVKFSNIEDFAHMRFLRHNGDDGPLILPADSIRAASSIAYGTGAQSNAELLADELGLSAIASDAVAHWGLCKPHCAAISRHAARPAQP
jgi:hypothetical protein